MDGKDAIIGKILDDAYRDAEATIAEAKEQAKAILERAENDAKVYAEKQNALISKEREDLLKRRKTVSELEGKKLFLKAKQEILDACFKRALALIRGLSEKEYLKLIEGMLKEAADGDVVTAAACDKAVVTKEFIDAYAKKRKIKLVLSDEYGGFSGGIILSSIDVDKNLTLEVEIASLRAETEPEISKLLFKETKK